MENERIILRPWRDSDAESLFKWASDPEVGPRAGWPPHKSVEESREIIRTVFHDVLNTWAIELKETGEAIGAIGYGPSCDCKLPAREGEPITGYWVAKPYWNQGICTEALRLMLDHIRTTTSIKSLISGHFIDNPASGRVMEKCGFVPTGETCIDETQYQGKDRPIRVLRIELDVVQTTELLRTSQSWDGAEMPDYPEGRPELVAIRYVFPPGKKLGWHHHDVMNYGIVEQGELTIITLDGKEKTVRAGEAVVEMVGTVHHGENRGSVPVILNMFYLSQKGRPLSVPHHEIPM